jgi:hypothetical protein
MFSSNSIATISALISLVSAVAAWKSETTAQRALDLQRTVAIAQMITVLNTGGEGTLATLCGILPEGAIDPVSYTMLRMSCAGKLPKK